MTYSLQPNQLALLTAAFADAQELLAANPTSPGNYAKVYDLLHALISVDSSGNSIISESSLAGFTPQDYQNFYFSFTLNDTTGWQPAAGIDPGAYSFLSGVSQVNLGAANPAGETDYSKFIRDYTAEQYTLRFGSTDPATLSAAIQNASNGIAFNILNSITVVNHGVIPDINNIAVNDASAAATSLFGQDQIAGWAGNALLLPVGHYESYQKNILHDPSSSIGGDGDVSNTYDVLSVIKSMEVAGAEIGIASSATLFSDVLTHVVTAVSGATDVISQAVSDTDSYLTNAYGPGHGLVFAIAENIILGTAVTGQTISGSDDYDIIRGGSGNDTILVSLGNDLMDGGDGANKVDYSSASSITVDIKDPDELLTTKYIGMVTKDFSSFFDHGEDQLYDISYIKGTHNNDVFNIYSIKNGLTLDGNGGSDDKADYSFYSSSGLTFSGSEKHLLVTDVSSGNSNSLINIEHIVGTSNQDTFDLTAPSGLTIDEDSGAGVINYSASLGVALQEIDTMHFKAIDGSGKIDYLNGFQQDNIHGVTTILPSTQQNGLLETGPANYNYSDSDVGGHFNIQGGSDINVTYGVYGQYIITGYASVSDQIVLNNGVYDAGSYSASSISSFSDFQLVINELNQSLDSTKFETNITGTNHGDVVNLTSPSNIVNTPSIFFSSGTGDDDITIGNGSRIATVEFTGGNDVIHNAADLAALQFWEGISLSDLHLSTASGNYADGGFNLTITATGFGSVVLEDVSADYHPDISLLSGGSVVFNPYGGVSLDGTSQYAAVVNGTWGDDTFTGRADATQTYYGLGGTNLMTAGDGAHDTFYGGGDTNTFVSESGTNTLYGGEGVNSYDVGRNAITTIANADGTNTVDFTDSVLSDYTLVSDGQKLAFLDSSLRPVLTIEDATNFGNVHFTDGQSYASSDLYQQAQSNSVALYFHGTGNDTYAISSTTTEYISDSEGLNSLLVSDLNHTDFSYQIDGNVMSLFANGNTTAFASVDGVSSFSTITFADGFSAVVSSLIAGTPQFIDGSSHYFDVSGFTEPVSIHLAGFFPTTYFGTDAGNIVWANSASTNNLIGGAGNDIFHAAGIGTGIKALGGDNILIGTGTDDNATTADYTRSPTGIVADLGTGIVSNGWGGTDTLINIHQIFGSSFDDTIIASSNNNLVDEIDGNNFLVSEGTNNTLNYSGASSGLYIDLADGYVEHGLYTDTAIGFQNTTDSLAGYSTIYGDEQNNNILLFGHDDFVYGGDGNDTITVEFNPEGNNYIYGGAGDDTINILGQSNGNTIVIQPGDGHDIINDMSGTSTIQIMGVDPSSLIYTQSGNDLIISYDDSITIQNYFTMATPGFQIEFDSGQTSSLASLVSTASDAGVFNHAPVAQDDSFSVFTNQSVSGLLMADNGHGADYDPDGDVLSVVNAPIIASTQAGGTISLFSYQGNFTYTAPHDFVGTDSYTYTIDDGKGATSTATVTFTVLPQAPIAQEDDFTGIQGQAIMGNLLADNGHGVDSDPNGSVLFVSTGTVATPDGTVTVHDDGSFVFTANADFTGLTTFNYLLVDQYGASSVGTVDLTILSPNQPPVAQPDDFSGSFGHVITGNVLLDNGHGPDSDPDGNPLSIDALTEPTAAGGNVILHADGTFDYMPQLGFAGTDSFTYTLLDGQGGTDTGTVTVSIAAPEGAIVGTNGDDSISGGNGGQTILGLDGNDDISGGNGSDIIYGGSGNDMLSGGNGSDDLYAVAGDNTLSGGNGEDRLFAGSGNDVLYGDNGSDLLVVGAGHAVMTGGNGHDTFQFTDIHGYGEITDFSNGDKIDLSQLIEVPNPQQDLIDQFVHATTQGNNTVLSVDTDGAANGSNFVAVATLQGVHDFDVSQALHDGTLIA